VRDGVEASKDSNGDSNTMPGAEKERTERESNVWDRTRSQLKDFDDLDEDSEQ
jgi:hypothetical protein